MKRIIPTLGLVCVLNLAVHAQLRFSWTSSESPTLITVEVFAENIGVAPEWLVGANLNLHFLSTNAVGFPTSFVIDPAAASTGCPFPMCNPPTAGPGLSAGGGQVIDGSWMFDGQSFDKRYVVALSSNFSTSTGLEVPPTNVENPPVKLGDIFLSKLTEGGFGSFQGAMGVNEAWTYTSSLVAGGTGGLPTGPCSAGAVPTCWITVLDPETQPFSGVLPVELVKFEASRYLGSSSRLFWQTASEENVSHYEIERSKDASNWDLVGKSNSQGNSQSVHNYTTIDHDVYDGRSARQIVYYRLKIIDRDGSFEYSGIKTVRFTSDSAFSAYIYPNPSSDELTIELNYGADTKPVTELTIYNNLGQVVYSMEVAEGELAVYLHHANTGLLAGSYLLELRDSDHNTLSQEKIIVQR